MNRSDFDDEMIACVTDDMMHENKIGTACGLAYLANPGMARAANDDAFEWYLKNSNLGKKARLKKAYRVLCRAVGRKTVAASVRVMQGMMGIPSLPVVDRTITVEQLGKKPH